MKVRVDAIKCQAYGTCPDVAPALFTLDEWGYAAVLGDGAVADGDEELARQAARQCPAEAISVDA
jgi:ferredoxin